MPKGYKTQRTLAKEAAREVLVAKVLAELGPLVDAQIKNALGISFLVVRDRKTGRVVRVAESTAKARLSSQEEIIEVWVKDPNVQAFTDLMNRALGKPAAQETLNMSAGIDIRWKDDLGDRLAKARRRVPEAAPSGSTSSS
jgi:hypothetical protein